MHPRAFFSHVTAAVLWGIWLPSALERSRRLDVSVPPGVRAPRDHLVRGHTLVERAGQVRLRLGLRVADEIEAWCQLAQILGLEDLVVAGESLLAKNRPRRRHLRELEAAVAVGGRPRQALLNTVLPLLREGVRSAMETRLRRLLVNAGLPEPEINKEIFAGGVRVAECDLVYAVQRVIVEYEGRQHFEEQATRDDIVKYERLQDLGWRVIRVTKDDLMLRPQETVERVRRALAR
jgi:very-short-patch-repair endonuclease